MTVHTIFVDPQAEDTRKLLQIGCHHSVKCIHGQQGLHHLAMLAGLSVIKQWCLRQS